MEGEEEGCWGWGAVAGRGVGAGVYAGGGSLDGVVKAFMRGRPVMFCSATWLRVHISAGEKCTY